MLKKVGASGQISLGKKHAKRVIEVVPQSSTVSAQPTNVRSGWLPPGGYTTCNQWASENRDALITYADRISEQGTAAEQLHEFLANAP